MKNQVTRLEDLAFPATDTRRATTRDLQVVAARGRGLLAAGATVLMGLVALAARPALAAPDNVALVVNRTGYRGGLLA